MTVPEQPDREARDGEFFRLLVENVVDYAIFVVDHEGLVQSWSHGAERLLGYREDEILDRTADVFYTPEDIGDRVPERVRREALTTGRGEDDRWHVRKDGTRFWSGGVMTPLRDEGGGLRGFAKIMRDRNGWWQAEKARLESEARTAAVLESIADAFFALDRAWRFTYVNSQAEELLGRRRDDLLGKNFWEEYPETVGNAIERHYRRAKEEGVAVEFEEFYPLYDRWYENHLYPSEGGLCIYFRDITGRRRTEEALKAGEERLRLAMAAGRMGTWDWDIKTGGLAWSDNLEEVYGLPPGGFDRTVEGFRRLVHPDDRDRVEAAIAHSIEGVSGYEAEFRFIRPDGLVGWMLGKGKVFADEAGRPARMIGIALDITERRRSEEAIRESEERFRHLADSMPQMVWVTRPDRSVEYVNRRWLDYTGQTQDECLGLAGWGAVIHPEDLGRVADASLLAHSGYEPFEAEYRIRDASGSYRWHLGRSVPVFDESGRFVRRFGAATDIDDRKQVERDAQFLAEASATLASIVDEASTLQRVARLAVPFFADWCTVDLADEAGPIRRLAVAHIDPAKVDLAHDLHRRYLPNPDALQGVPQVVRTGSPEMVAEITDDMIVAGARDEEHLLILRELGLKSYMCVPLKGRIRTLGAILFVAAESGRRYGPDDLRLAEDLASRAAIAVENSRLYAELKEADRRKNDFLATLAHELRNPLAPIRNTLRLMREPDGEGRMEAERAMAERNVVHLARLIDDLMDVARINRGRIELGRQVVDLGSIVRQAVETARPLIDDRRHELTVAVPEVAIRVDADPTRLEQVLWNLLNNSAKYTPLGGHIRLSVESDGAEVVVRVRDTGIGIRAEMLPRVFDMFVQVREHRDHAQGGLGIGLSLVRTLVEMHSGTITASSAGPGHGSEFVVRLPLLVGARPNEAGDGGHRRRTDAKPHRHRILVVDDNVDAARSLSRLLERLYGQDVRVAHDGPEALLVAEDFRPEVILLDIGLPGMDGNEVARRLRGRAEFQRTLIIALTGWGQDDDLARSREAGFDHHLVKPADPDALRDLLINFHGSSP